MDTPISQGNKELDQSILPMPGLNRTLEVRLICRHNELTFLAPARAGWYVYRLSPTHRRRLVHVP
jgi:hypothetical protein